MAVNNEEILSWTFMSKAKPSEEMLSILIEGEEILQCYKTVRDQAALTNKRIIIFDKQGITGKKIEIYSLPFRSIDMWSSENAGKLFDINAELELWTKAGHFKLKLDPKCDIREFDIILSKYILNS
ncbi:PH domain-containing protein [Amedibacterium intestinale]|uniref:PH domain-containing protein n=1 Tax=Amedibacterium intestinale TaxID=2583452 RepID=UPI000E1FC552